MSENITDGKRFQHVQSSLIFCNNAVKELCALLGPYKIPEVQTLVSSPPFDFYRASLTYVIVMEYYKLMENKIKKDSPQLSSVCKLLDEVIKDAPEKFSKKGLEYKMEIETLALSEIGNKLIKYRDKKFGHSDISEVNNPLNIPGLNVEEIIETKNHLRYIEIILKSIGDLYGHTFFIENPIDPKSPSGNFFVFTTFARKYFNEHYIDALAEGYDLINGSLGNKKSNS